MSQIIGSLFLTLVSFGLNFFIKRKPDVRFFFGPISSIPWPNNADSAKYHGEEQPKQSILMGMWLKMHAVVILNSGNKTAKNIRIGHHWLPAAYSVEPAMNILNPDNKNEILIPTLCAKEQVMISYLYPANVRIEGITSYIKCDEGRAKPANLQHVRSFPFILFRTFMFYVGIFATIYVGWGIMDFINTIIKDYSIK